LGWHPRAHGRGYPISPTCSCVDPCWRASLEVFTIATESGVSLLLWWTCSFVYTAIYLCWIGLWIRLSYGGLVAGWCVWAYLQISIWTWPVIRLRICGLVLRFIHMILGYYYQLLPCLYRIDLLCYLAMLVAWSCVAVLCG
jgi:hypothetical protein